MFARAVVLPSTSVVSVAACLAAPRTAVSARAAITPTRLSSQVARASSKSKAATAAKDGGARSDSAPSNGAEQSSTSSIPPASTSGTQSLRRGVDLAGQGQQQLEAAAATAAAAATSSAASPNPSSTPSETTSAPASKPAPAPTPTRPIAQPYQHRRVSSPTQAQTQTQSQPIGRNDLAATKQEGGPSSVAPSLSVNATVTSSSSHTNTSASPDVISGTVLSPGESNEAGPSSAASDESSLPSAALALTSTATTEDSTFAQRRRRIRHPFNTFAFVHRLRAAGFPKGKQRATDQEGELSAGVGEGEGMRRDETSADVIMDATRNLLMKRGEWVLENHQNKGDLENEAYLFSAALAELRTETQVRARNDGAALRSMTTLLQREVDALDLKMREDISMLKHDIQIEMNTRKAELKEGQNSIEQEIQDLNNRFTISLSDLKTEIEQNIKWDATRRSLALVFGIAAIVMTTLTLADVLTRDEQAAAALASTSPSSGANKGAPAGSASDEAARVAREASMNLRDPRSPLADGAEHADSTGVFAAEEVLTATSSAEELGLVPRYDLEALRII